MPNSHWDTGRKHIDMSNKFPLPFYVRWSHTTFVPCTQRPIPKGRRTRRLCSAAWACHKGSIIHPNFFWQNSVYILRILFDFIFVFSAQMLAWHISWSSLVRWRISTSTPTGRCTTDTLPPKMQRHPGDGGCWWPTAKRRGCNSLAGISASIWSWSIKRFLSQQLCPPELFLNSLREWLEVWPTAT